MNLDDYITIPKNWNGPNGTVPFEIRWCPDCIGFDDGTSMAHLEIISHERKPLPVTETGYRSHFIGKEAVENFGGQELYVDAWFAYEMTTATGKLIAAPKQLSLF